MPPEQWAAADATFDSAAQQEDEDAGRWRFRRTPPDHFELGWGAARFNARFTGFRHLAFFPEQAANWAWIDGAVRKMAAPDGGRPRVLNLFGYTGVASLVAGAAGAAVTHVDASKKSVNWARENAELSKLQHHPMRWIVEDARKYVAREVKRGSLYEGIILDPPKYGRGPTGEVWRLFEDLPELARLCAQLLSPSGGFLILNAYAARISGLSLAHLLAAETADRGGAIDWGELALAEEGRDARALGLSFFAAGPGCRDPMIPGAREISSLANAQVKAARALHLRKEREASGLFLTEGLKIAAEGMELGRAPKTLMFGDETADHPLLRRLAAFTLDHGGEVLQVTRDILEKVSRKENPQTVVAVFEQAFTPLETLDPSAAEVWVALQGVRDPGNVGTIVRTADAAGCGGVVLVGDTVDPFGVEAVRATMGSIFAVPIFRATEAEFLSWRASWPGSLVGTLLTASEDFRSADYRRPTMILMGAESHGLPPALAAACDANVKIPMRGRADSLNLAVATGVMIYAATG